MTVTAGAADDEGDEDCHGEGDTAAGEAEAAGDVATKEPHAGLVNIASVNSMTDTLLRAPRRAPFSSITAVSADVAPVGRGMWPAANGTSRTFRHLGELTAFPDRSTKCDRAHDFSPPTLLKGGAHAFGDAQVSPIRLAAS